jgi:hypothetical protein
MLIESPEWQNAVVKLCIGLMFIIIFIWYMFSEIKEIIEKNKKGANNGNDGKQI